MQLPHPIIQPFINYLRFEKRYARHTITAYQTDLISFLDYVEVHYGATPLNQLSHSFIRSWLASLRDENLTAKTINRKISTLKSFFKYQIKTGLLQQNPMIKIVAPKPEKRLPSFVEDKDIKKLLTEVEFPEGWEGKTHQLLLRLFYSTGLRLSEAISLKRQNVDLSNCIIKVLGKGNKERLLPIAPNLAFEIQAYISCAKKEFACTKSDMLLLDVKGSALRPKQVYTIVKKYLSQVTTIEKRSPHVLRHSFATHLMNNGADLNAVKDLLGHSSLAATQVYTHNTIEKLKNIHKKAHPKA